MHYLDGLENVRRIGLLPNELEAIVEFVDATPFPYLRSCGEYLKESLIGAARERYKWRGTEDRLKVNMTRICKKVQQLDFFSRACLHVWGLLGVVTTDRYRYAQTLYQCNRIALVEYFLSSLLGSRDLWMATVRRYVGEHPCSALAHIADSIDIFKKDYPELFVDFWMRQP